jgi:hypothetical protein
MPTMFTVIRTRNNAGKLREHRISLPMVSALLLEQEQLKYFAYPDEPEPAPEKPPPRKWGAQPRRGGREVIEME